MRKHQFSRRDVQAGSSWVRRKMAKLLRDILNNGSLHAKYLHVGSLQVMALPKFQDLPGMQIAIHDFEIRYEDESSGICGPHRIVGRICLQIQARSIRCSIEWLGASERSKFSRISEAALWWTPCSSELSVSPMAMVTIRIASEPKAGTTVWVEYNAGAPRPHEIKQVEGTHKREN